MKQRLINDNLARALHQRLYERMVAFCEQYTPELPAHIAVENWLRRLYDNDERLHILVNFDAQWNLNGHAVIEVQEAFGCKIVYCHQVHADKGMQSTLDEGIQYVENLRKEVDAHCSVFTVTRHVKGLEKKYGYKVIRTIMLKYKEE